MFIPVVKNLQNLRSFVNHEFFSMSETCFHVHLYTVAWLSLARDFYMSFPINILSFQLHSPSILAVCIKSYQALAQVACSQSYFPQNCLDGYLFKFGFQTTPEIEVCSSRSPFAMEQNVEER